MFTLSVLLAEWAITLETVHGGFAADATEKHLFDESLTGSTNARCPTVILVIEIENTFVKASCAVIPITQVVESVQDQFCIAIGLEFRRSLVLELYSHDFTTDGTVLRYNAGDF